MRACDAAKELFGISPEERPGEAWLPTEPELQEREPDRACLDSLTGDPLEENMLWADLPGEWRIPLEKSGRIIRDNPALGSLFCFARELLIREEEAYEGSRFASWPARFPPLGEESPLFYLHLLLQTVPEVRSLHARQGIPEKITRETCRGIGSKGRDFAFFNDRPGMDRIPLYWCRNHMAGRLYRAGRMEYMRQKCREDLSVYRDPASGNTRLFLKDPGQEGPALLCPRSDGRGRHDLSAPPAGWRRLLGPGDDLLDVHIPGGGSLSAEAVLSSFREGAAFFDRTFPGSAVKGFICSSWIFSIDLEGAYPPGSNLIRFRDQVYLFPVPTADAEGLRFLFGTPSKDPADWPERTGVQRRLKAHLQAGGKFRLSGMIYLREDLERYGTFPYRDKSDRPPNLPG